MEKFITSDLHFWHTRIIDYCKRPYTHETLDKMNEDILAEFDKLPAKSTILNLGDLYLNSKRTFEEIKYLVDRMKSNDKKLEILLGNHDFSAPRYMKGNHPNLPLTLFYKLGFDEVYEKPFGMDGMVFCHEPVYFPEGGIKVVHGHTHDKDIDEDYFINGNQATDKIIPKNYINVCWDRRHMILPYDFLFQEITF